MGRFVSATDALMEYLSDVGAREAPSQVHCRKETQKMPMAMMQIAPEQGAFMALLAKLTNARKYVEIGTFTGYSALSVALAMPADGKVDRARRQQGVHRPRARLLEGSRRRGQDRSAPWSRPRGARQDDRARRGPVRSRLHRRRQANYDGYYERVLKLLRPGGLIALDNMLWSGAVADPEVTDADTSALRALNAKIHADQRVDMALATIGDGVMLARKR